MPASAFLLAFAAAWIHGISNVFVGRRQEPEAAFAFMLVVGVIAFAPIAVLTWDVDAAAIPYIAASRRSSSATSRSSPPAIACPR